MVLGVYCAGGFGGVVMEMAKDINSHSFRWDYLCFITDTMEGTIDSENDIIFYDDFKSRFSSKDAEVIIASGEPKGRELLYNKVKDDGYKLPNLIDPLANIKKFTSLGEGNIIQDYAHISPSNVSIGNNNVFMTFSRIAHDSIVGNHCVFTSSTNCSGKVIVEDRVYVGTGAKLRDKIILKHDSIIGMGAVVTKTVEEYSVVVGSPAKEIRKNTGKVF